MDLPGLYLSPLELALVLSCDEKRPIQALNRSQPGLPMKAGRPGDVNHEHKHHRTTTLFAAPCALDDGLVPVGVTAPVGRHRQLTLQSAT